MQRVKRLGERLRHAVTPFAAQLAAGALAIAWFLYLGYGPTLLPTNVAWMLHGDRAAYFWGFTFFRNAPWALPLGDVPNLFFPFGTTVGFTDANPWLSVLFRALSPLLPELFQFSGLWYLLCFVLLAVLGARIAASFSEDEVIRALGGALFAVSPLLPSRSGHVTLCAFFFVAAGVRFNIAPARTRADALRLTRHMAVWLAWAAGTHGYLSMMLLALSVAAVARLTVVERSLRARDAALIVAGYGALSAAVYWLFGYIGGSSAALGGGGFGRFSSDLTALVNPMGWSRFMPSIHVRATQGEGFAYLGAGVLALLAVRGLLFARAPSTALSALRRHWPLLVVVLAMWVYSLSSRVSYRGETALWLGELYAPFKSLTAVFRSSGRFVWPLHFALVALAVSAAARLKDARLGRAALLVAVLLQAAELRASRLDFRAVPLRPLEHRAWAESAARYEHLALAPLHLLWTCAYDAELVNRLGYEAYRRRWTFNSGNFGRKPKGAKELCDAPTPIDRATIYVPDATERRRLEQSGFTCGRLDRLTVCVASDRPSALLTALREHRR